MRPIPFDSLTLAAVVDDLQTLVGGRIQRISQPNEYLLVLTVYARDTGELRWLFDCSASWARTHLTQSRLPNPPAPPPFCMTLRKHLEGGIVQSVAQRGFDRVLDVEVRGHEGAAYTLTAELMGKHSNIVLVSAEGVILQSAKLISAKMNRFRETLPGRPYVPPPATGKPDPLDVSRDNFLRHLHTDAPEDLAGWLRQNFEGISSVLATEIIARAGDTPSPATVWQAFDSVFAAARAGGWQPVLIRDENGVAHGACPIPLRHLELALQERQADIEAALDKYYAVAIPAAALESRRRSLAGALRKMLAARDLSLDQVRHGTRESSKAAQYRRWGELLLSQLHQVSPGRDTVQLLDYYADPPAAITVRLDPLQTPQQNAERFFQRARHVEQNAERLQELEQRLTDECDALEAALTRVETATDLEELQRERENAAARGWLQTASPQAPGQAPAKSSFDGKRVRTFTSPDGYEVLVGENAEANDYLVRHVAQPNDWWLHVRAGTSAHVVVRTGNAPQRVPPDTLHFAARLAAAYSRGKHANVVAVDYTLRKYVRKPRHAAPGMVTYTHEKTLDVAPAELSR